MTKNHRQLHCTQEVIPYKSFTKKANLMKLYTQVMLLLETCWVMCSLPQQHTGKAKHSGKQKCARGRGV